MYLDGFPCRGQNGDEEECQPAGTAINISVRKCSYIYLGKKADADDFTQPFLYGF